MELESSLDSRELYSNKSKMNSLITLISKEIMNEQASHYFCPNSVMQKQWKCYCTVELHSHRAALLFHYQIIKYHYWF